MTDAALATPAPAGDVSIRFINEATRVSPVDIYLVPSTSKLISTSPVATSVVFGGNTGYINVPTDTYAIAVVPAGTVPVTVRSFASICSYCSSVSTRSSMRRRLKSWMGSCCVLYFSISSSGR